MEGSSITGSVDLSSEIRTRVIPSPAITAQNTTRTRRVRARKCQPPRRQVGARARLASPPCGTSGPEERWRGSEIGTTGNAKTRELAPVCATRDGEFGLAHVPTSPFLGDVFHAAETGRGWHPRCFYRAALGDPHSPPQGDDRPHVPTAAPHNRDPRRSAPPGIQRHDDVRAARHG